MGATIIGPTSEEFPKVVYPPLVYLKKDWADDWEYRPDVEMLDMMVATSGQDLGRCALRTRYGSLKHPWEYALSTHSAMDLRGYWVRVQLVSDDGPQTAWEGRIWTESRNAWGNQANGPAGRQIWTAYEPLYMLQRIHVSRSFWWIDEADKEIGWLPPVNDRDGRGWLVGNRIDDLPDGEKVYRYGGTSQWTHLEYIYYLLEKFVNGDDEEAAPQFTLDGQKALLARFVEAIPLRDGMSVAEILRLLVPVEWGVDYTIVPTEDGYAIRVFTLTPQEIVFGKQKLTANPDTLEIKTGETRDNVQTHVVTTSEQQFGTIRVLGGRIIVCCTLKGENLQPENTSLVDKWNSDVETEYLAGVGETATAEEHDIARTAEKYAQVYARFGAPDDWNFQDGDAAPKLNKEGELDEEDQPADCQLTVRRTLDWLPLKEHVDYSEDPEVDHNGDDRTPDFRRPMVWVKSEILDDFLEGFGSELDDADESNRGFMKAEEIGAHVAVSETDWGIHLTVNPNHLLAKDHFDDAVATEAEPLYDWQNLVATIAFEADQRLMLEHSIPDATPADGILEIEVPDAEYWYLAPNTYVEEEMARLLDSGDDPRALRDDTDRLTMIMAGAIARYGQPRARAKIVVKGLKPWSSLIGTILTVVEEGGDVQPIYGPITSVSYTGGTNPTTTIDAGFAL